MLCSQIFLFVATLGVSVRVVERQDDGRNHILNYDCVGDQSKGDMPGTPSRLPRKSKQC